jgi:hypothetical protein
MAMRCARENDLIAADSVSSDAITLHHSDDLNCITQSLVLESMVLESMVLQSMVLQLRPRLRECN